MFKKIFKALVYSVALLFLLVSTAGADEIAISNNGGGSSNNVQVSNSSSTTATQTNNADVQNNVSNDANTGGNQASSNNGDVSINTGNATSTTDINNQNINTNNFDSSCNCISTSTNVDISGNGSDSTSAINLGVGSDINISQQNSATITNNVSNYANTGYNSANNNNGDVVIDTGNAFAAVYIKNKNINLNTDPQGGILNNLSISINGNGVNSSNLVDFIFNNTFNYSSNNIAVLYNNVTNYANTGGNTAGSNNGSVLIATGDAVSVVGIANENINGSSVTFCPTEIIPTPPPPPTGGGPETLPPPGSNPSPTTSVQSAAGQVLGAAIGAILPATGGYFLLLMTILCLTIFLAGWYLRFGSGISPPFSYAV